jgi:hypothetical protein
MVAKHSGDDEIELRKLKSSLEWFKQFRKEAPVPRPGAQDVPPLVDPENAFLHNLRLDRKKSSIASRRALTITYLTLQVRGSSSQGRTRTLP